MMIIPENSLKDPYAHSNRNASVVNKVKIIARIENIRTAVPGWTKAVLWQCAVGDAERLVRNQACNYVICLKVSISSTV